MFKRFVCLLAAFSVFLSSASAWTAESFTGWDFNPEQPSDQELSVVDDPVLYSVNSSDSGPFDLDFSSGVYEIFDGSSSSRPFVRQDYDIDIFVPPSGNVHSSSFVVNSPVLSSLSFLADPSGSFICQSYTTLPAIPVSTNNITYTSTSGCYWGVDEYSVALTYDLPALSNTISFDFSFPLSSVYGRMRIANNYQAYILGEFTRLDVSLDGTVVKSYLGPTVDASYIYSSVSSPASKLTLRFYFRPSTSTIPNSFDGRETRLTFMFILYPGCKVVYDYLLADDQLGGWNDEAQDSLNKHEGYETEWAGSMTDNFNKLDLSSFVFDSGAVDGFGLLSGIVNDLYNALGPYRILYIFPLLLGIALLVIGRISKSRQKDSSKGDS